QCYQSRLELGARVKRGFACFSENTGSTPGTSKTFQPQRCGLISTIVVAPMVEKAFEDCDNFYRLDRCYRICFYARRKQLCETPALPVSECDKAENATYPCGRLGNGSNPINS